MSDNHQKIDGYGYFLVARAYVREGGKDGEAVRLVESGDAIPLAATRNVDMARKILATFDNKDALTSTFVKDVPVTASVSEREQNEKINKISDLVDGLD